MTISGNRANQQGGGIWSAGAPLLRLENTTVSGNEAPYHGGVVNENGAATVIHSTFSGNRATAPGGTGGGFSHLQFGAATLTFENSIAEGNSAAVGPDVYKNAGTFTPTGANLIGNNASVSAEFPESPLHGTPARPLVLLLSPLLEWNRILLSPLLGSPAIDGAIAAANSPISDQRGIARPVGPARLDPPATSEPSSTTAMETGTELTTPLTSARTTRRRTRPIRTGMAAVTSASVAIRTATASSTFRT